MLLLLLLLLPSVLYTALRAFISSATTPCT
jgi:hypothetical protein